MIYNGPNALDCTFGGLTYHGIAKQVRHRPRMLPKSARRNYRQHFVTTLCDSYTQTPENNSIAKVPMNYVSTESYLLIIIYGYYPYNEDMYIDIEISLTPCKGILCLNDKECKYNSL